MSRIIVSEDDVRAKNEVLSCAPKQRHAITKSTECPNVGRRSRGRMQGARVNRFLKGGVRGSLISGRFQVEKRTAGPMHLLGEWSK